MVRIHHDHGWEHNPIQVLELLCLIDPRPPGEILLSDRLLRWRLLVLDTSGLEGKTGMMLGGGQNGLTVAGGGGRRSCRHGRDPALEYKVLVRLLLLLTRVLRDQVIQA